MANPLDLREEINFTTLFNRATIHANNRDAIINAKSDEEKYVRGINWINDKYRTLFDSRSHRGQVRDPVHSLSNGWVKSKGVNWIGGVEPFRFWCATFDLYNRSNPQDPNGPRRLIAILENMPGQANPRSGRVWYTPDGGFFRHLLYTNNHYGDKGRGPSMAYVHKWPLQDHGAGQYSVLTDAGAVF